MDEILLFTQNLRVVLKNSMTYRIDPSLSLSNNSLEFDAVANFNDFQKFFSTHPIRYQRAVGGLHCLNFRNKTSSYQRFSLNFSKVPKG